MLLFAVALPCAGTGVPVLQRRTLFREPYHTLLGLQVLSTAIAMLQSLMAKITSRMTNKPAGADDADLEKLRFVVEVTEVEPCQ